MLHSGRRFSLRGSILLQLLLLAAWVLLPLSSRLAAQDDTPAELFIDRVDVNVVNVEVFVSDRDGNHVTDLSVEEFEILEDGQPVEISNFFTVARRDKVLDNLERDRDLISGQSPPIGAAPRIREVPEDQRLHLLIYMDLLNMRPQSKKRVLADLKGFLEDRMTQGDRVMLVGFNRSIDVVEPFTEDREAIFRGLAALEKAATYRQIDLANLRRTVRNMSTDAAAGDFDSAYQNLRSYVQGANNDLRQTIKGLGSVVRSLAGLPGRKALLYVSDGLPQRPGEELYSLLRELTGTESFSGFGGDLIDPSIEALRQDQSSLYSSVTREANAHQVTLYTMDARGSAGESTLSAEFNFFTETAGGRGDFDAIRSMSFQEPLLELAITTGGSAVLNTFNFEQALGGISRDFDSFYSLGYRSRRGGDGKYHDIEVRITRPGLRVRHREGYLDKPEGERVADRVLSSLILDLEKNPLGVELDFGTPEKIGRGKYLLPIIVRVPFRDLTLLPHGEVEEGRLSIFVAVQDERGGISDLAKIPYPLSIPNALVARAREQELGYQTQLKIGRGTPKIVVGVWDELSGTESFVQKRVLVGEEKGRKKKKSGRRGL